MEDMRNDFLQEGIQIGKQEGIQIGKQAGKQEGLIETAKRMLNSNMLTLDEIAQFVDLSLDEIQKLQAGQ